MRRQILQLFNWKLEDCITNLEDIKNSKFTHIQLSPLQGIKEEYNGDNWFAFYQPCNYKVGNPLGTKEQLINLCKKANEIGLKVLVDVVFHHVANQFDNDISPMVDKDIVQIEDLFYPTSFYNIQNYSDHFESTHLSLGGLPALNLSSKKLRKLQFDYLKELRDCGVSGARFDAIRHMSEDDFYFEDMREMVGENFMKESYGECIECSYDEVKFYQRYMRVGTNASVNKDDFNLVLWAFSHDDHCTFNKSLSDELINREYIFLRDNYNADILYYAKSWNNSWKYAN